MFRPRFPYTPTTLTLTWSGPIPRSKFDTNRTVISADGWRAMERERRRLKASNTSCSFSSPRTKRLEEVPCLVGLIYHLLAICYFKWKIRWFRLPPLKDNCNTADKKLRFLPYTIRSPHACPYLQKKKYI